MDKTKSHIKKLVDNCPLFQGMKQYHIAHFFSIAPGHWTSIYHEKKLPGREAAFRIVQKLREAGYPDLKYEDVWCPKEEICDAATQGGSTEKSI
jgi:hypothetical protein